MTGSKRGGARGGGFKKGFAKKRAASSDDESAPRAGKKAKGDEEDESIPMVPELKKDDDGNAYISLNTSGKRRVTISDYQKSTLVSIREYWVNNDGELKPGKKGISLTIDQYNTLLAAAPLIESALAKKEIEVVRPDYEADLGAKAETAKEDDKEVGEQEAEEVEQVQKVEADEDE
ncbi:PC4-domain-containing protein [Clathrospora elynae]|uniref:PC4-domain-containing protein n=1 Tax=Clathrospora elynae TaxID=706981 RepID=A0A6A5T1Q1_9PLEO|nr:PC4-domain-containing protein [Clathrospora elynae]